MPDTGPPVGPESPNGPLRPTTPAAAVTTPDGVAVAYYDFGGNGPPLLLAHATGFCGPVLEPLAARLRARFHCVALDLRGHGVSGRPRGWDFDWHGFGTDVLAVVDHLGLDSPFGFGHSCGGAALLLAEEARPGTFAGLYCFEPVVYPGDVPLAPTVEGNPLAAGAMRRREEFGSRREAIANFARKAPFDRLPLDVLASYVDNGFAPAEGGGIRLRCRRQDEAQVFAHALSHDAYARLNRIRCPVTLACGAQTDGFGPDVLEAFLPRLAASTLVVSPGIGHFGPLEDPAAVAVSVLDSLVPVNGTPEA
ncbi:MAG TPA: alpha/beta hydrolase [Acidimicrobiales bacterium]|nr:alpha/beta hydrolase [Acidimicrobiales bacterium]HLN41486.1 alpha/beta hydrolase [Acidimicrobiales bacterium]